MFRCLELKVEGFRDSGYKVYLDSKSTQNNGVYGRYYGCRAIISHTFGI